jgi:replicative DNA helicase
VLEAERELLASCLTNPAVYAEFAGWLTPQDFSRPEHAATWAAIDSLAQTGAPIDYVTLAWQCQRHNPDYNSPGLSPDQLATMARHPPGFSAPAVATVAHAALLRHTDAAHEQIQSVAQDRTTDALTVVSTAEKAYRDVGQHARRLFGTTMVSRISAALDSSRPGAQPNWAPSSPETLRPGQGRGR